MAIYGQSWRGGGNMSFRNPMAKAAMNNNPMGNQQTMRPSELAVPPQPLGMANLAKPTQSAGGMALKGVVAGIQANPATQPSYGTGRSPYSSDLIAPTGVALGMNRAESARQGAMLSTPQYRSPVAQNGLGGMGQQPRPFSQNGIRVDMPRQPLINQGIAAGLGGQNQPGGAYRARGIQPGMLPRLKPEADAARATQYRNQWENRTGTEYVMSPDDYRVATGGYGQAMYPPGSGGQVSGGNSMSQAGISSVANARIARAARQRGVTSSGIDQWRKTSPIAQTIQSNADTRIANLPQNPAPQVQPVTVQSAPAIAPQVQPVTVQSAPAIAPQVQQTSPMDLYQASGPPQPRKLPLEGALAAQNRVDAPVPIENATFSLPYGVNPAATPLGRTPSQIPDRNIDAQKKFSASQGIPQPAPPPSTEPSPTRKYMNSVGDQLNQPVTLDEAARDFYLPRDNRYSTSRNIYNFINKYWRQ